jgi:NitT/TauT family transport system permease protein
MVSTVESRDTVTETAVAEPGSLPSPPPRAEPGRGRTAALRARTIAARSSAIVAFLALWQLAPTFGWVDKTFLSPLSEVLAAAWDLILSGELWTNTSASLIRSLSGFTIAVLVAVPVGLLIAHYKTVSEILTPLFTVFLNTAAVALLPVFVLIFGIGETSKIAIITYACFWPVLYNTISGARNVDPLLIRSVESLGVTGPRLFQKVIVPAALPTIFTGIRLAGAASIVVLITTELVGAKAGLGYLISNSQFNFQIPQMYAGILTVAVVGVGFNGLLAWAEKKLTRGRAG